MEGGTLGKKHIRAVLKAKYQYFFGGLKDERKNFCNHLYYGISLFGLSGLC